MNTDELNNHCQKLLKLIEDGKLSHQGLALVTDCDGIDLTALVVANLAEIDDGYVSLTNEGEERGVNHDKIIAYAKDLLAGYGIHADEFTWDEYRGASVWWFNREVLATHKQTGDAVVLSRIHIDCDSEVLQCGSNYGRLTL